MRNLNSEMADSYAQLKKPSYASWITIVIQLDSVTNELAEAIFLASALVG